MVQRAPKAQVRWVEGQMGFVKKLKGKETSLGWDHEEGTIVASDEWWLKNIEVSFSSFFQFPQQF